MNDLLTYLSLLDVSPSIWRDARLPGAVPASLSGLWGMMSEMAGWCFLWRCQTFKLFSGCVTAVQSEILNHSGADPALVCTCLCLGACVCVCVRVCACAGACACACACACRVALFYHLSGDCLSEPDLCQNCLLHPRMLTKAPCTRNQW